MTTDAKRQPPDQDSDYDGAWKDALRLYLPLFLRVYFPKLYERIDWTCQPEWLDKEISQVLAQATSSPSAICAAGWSVNPARSPVPIRRSWSVLGGFELRFAKERRRLPQGTGDAISAVNGLSVKIFGPPVRMLAPLARGGCEDDLRSESADWP